VLKYRVPQGSHPPRSLVRDGQPSPHRPRLVVSRSTCPPISPPPHVNSFVLGPAVINTHTSVWWSAPPWVGSISPDGWDQIPRWAGGWACTSHPGVLASIPKREEPGKTGRHPVLKYRVPHGSQRSLVCGGQPSPHKPRLVVSHSTSARRFS
jgi:hypothetical protein